MAKPRHTARTEEQGATLQADQLEQLLAAKRQKEAIECWQAIQTICEERGFELTAIAQVSPDGRIVAFPRLDPKQQR